MKLSRLLSTAAVALSAAFAFGTTQASVVFVSGTDAMSLHGDAEFIAPVLLQLQGASTKNVLVIGTNFINNTTGVGLTYGGLTLGSEVLSDYSAIIFASPCCDDPYLRLGTRAADVDAYVAAGGGLYIEDYQGNTAWDAILDITPGGGLTSMIDGSVSTGAACIDPGVSTASGIAFGFNASYTEGCFVHQSYDSVFWASQGYFALQTKEDTSAWVTMAFGFTDPGNVPEPASLALTGLALLGLGAARRARKTA